VQKILDIPGILFAISFAGLWCSTEAGVLTSYKLPQLSQGEREDFNIVLTATLTLLGLIIGFTFSMAINRYDLRKNYEASEANTIGTEYFRAGLLTPTEAVQVRGLMREYLNHRIMFYEMGNTPGLAQIGRETDQIQTQMWTVVEEAASAKPTPIVANVVSGMNEVFDAEGYAQAAWWNRIPVAAWVLMVAIAVCCNFLVGYGVHRRRALLLLVLPFVLSVAFLLIADIDSPRHGIILVEPQDLLSVSHSLQ
jgi:hypothetical protein